MWQVSDQQFQELIAEAIDSLVDDQKVVIKNIAVVYQLEPTSEQRIKLELRNNQTLLGLYEGVPLSHRQGQNKILPDKITLFKYPIEAYSASYNDLKKQIRHTLWHELAHYYGLDHQSIDRIDIEEFKIKDKN